MLYINAHNECSDSNYNSANDNQIQQTAAIFNHNRVSCSRIGRWCQLALFNLSSTPAIEILTLQGSGIDEVDGAGDTDAHTHLTHVPQALCQPWWKAHYVVLATRQNQTTQESDWGRSVSKKKAIIILQRRHKMSVWIKIKLKRLGMWSEFKHNNPIKMLTSVDGKTSKALFRYKTSCMTPVIQTC